MTDTKKLDGKTNLENLLASIKSRVTKVQELGNQISHVKTRLWSDVYAYIEGIVASGQVPNTETAVRYLAKMLSRPYGTVGNMYYAGKFMRHAGLKPDDVDSASVWIARHTERVIPKADYLRTLDAIRNNKGAGAVAKIVERARLKNGAATESRMRRMVKDGRFNKTTMQMEMIAMLTMLRKFHKEKDGYLVFYDSAGEAMMQAGWCDD